MFITVPSLLSTDPAIIYGQTLERREWAPGFDLPTPKDVTWMYHFGLCVVTIIPLLATIVVGLRIWSRWTGKLLGLDDAFMVAAAAVNVGYSFSLIMYVKSKYVGVHSWDVQKLTPSQVSTGKLFEWLIILLYHPVLSLVKASVLCFHFKLTGTKKGVRWCVYILSAVNLMSMVAVFCVTLFQCNPISTNWDPNFRRTCINNRAFNYAYNAIIITTDIMVLAIPFYVLMNLQMRSKLKIALLGVFFLGFIVTIISIIRLVLLVQFFRDFYANVTNPELYVALGWIASPLEVNLGIIAASIPALWPLFRRWFPNFFSRLDASYPVNTWPSTGAAGRTGGRTGNGTVGGFRSNMRSNMGTHPGTTRGNDSEDDSDSMYAMKPMQAGNGSQIRGNTEIRSQTPSGSQDGIIVDHSNGILRTTNVDVTYDNSYNPGRPTQQVEVIDEKDFEKKRVQYVV